MLRLLLALAAAAACTAAAAETTSSSSSSSAVSTTLEPGKPYQACMTLAAGDKRRWYFKADGPVDLTIHAKGGDDAGAVKRERMRGDGGTFVAKSAQDYCWTWTASKPTKLEAKIQ